MTRIEVLVVAIAVCVAGCVAQPATEKARAAADHTKSIKNLHQIGVACQSFHDSYNRMPTNGTSGTADWHQWSSQFLILAYVEGGDIYNKATGKGLVSPTTQELCPQVAVKVFLCPARGRSPGYATAGGSSPGIKGPFTDYALNTVSFSGTCLPNLDGQSTNIVTLSAITNINGTANTILYGEKAMDPANYGNTASANGDEDIYSGGYAGTGRSGNMIVFDTDGNARNAFWGSPFDGGCPFLMCDGSTRLISYRAAGNVNFTNALNWKNVTPIDTSNW